MTVSGNHFCEPIACRPNTQNANACALLRNSSSPIPRLWFTPEWLADPEAATICLRDIVFVVMTAESSHRRRRIIRDTWAAPIQSLDPARLLFVYPSPHNNTNPQKLYDRIQNSQFEGLIALQRSEKLRRSAWTMLVDDDTFVNLPHLMRMTARLNSITPLLVGHVLDRVWPHRNTRAYPDDPAQGDPPRQATLQGGAGMLLSYEAVRRVVDAMARGQMPLPKDSVYAKMNDIHLSHYARRLGITTVHSNLFWPTAAPADARITSGSYLADRNSIAPQLLSTVTIHCKPAEHPNPFFRHAATNCIMQRKVKWAPILHVADAEYGMCLVQWLVTRALGKPPVEELRARVDSPGCPSMPQKRQSPQQPAELQRRTTVRKHGPFTRLFGLFQNRTRKWAT
jgi:hypothetical protein